MCLVVVSVLWNTSAVLLPFFIGILIAYVLAPAVSFVARCGVPRLVAVLLAYLLLFGSTASFILYLMPQLQSEARRFARRFQGAPQQVSRAVDQRG
jgi:predicted PurR-regulated permease PerM